MIFRLFPAMGSPVLLRRLAVAACAIATLLVLSGLWLDLQAGGHSWKQGDWLISLAAGPVRRGPFGSAVLVLSDVFGISPLTLVAGLQAALVVTLFGALATVVRRPKLPLEALVLLVSPAFLLIFWPADPNGALRKELIALTAAALVLCATGTRFWRPAVWSATAVYALAMLGHEANAALAPLMILLIHSAPGEIPEPEPVPGISRVLPQVLVLALSLAGLAYALAFPGLTDAALLCQPLRDHGLQPLLCQGAIDWIALPADHGAAMVQERLLTYRFPLEFASGALLSLAAVAYGIRRLHRPFRLTLLALCAALPVTLLYPAALDWGRWLSLQVTAAVFVVLSQALSGQTRLQRPGNRLAVAALVLLGLTWSPEHRGQWLPGGLALRLAKDITAPWRNPD